MSATLAWLPKHSNWNQAFEAARRESSDNQLAELARLAEFSLDFVQTAKLDRVVNGFVERAPDYPFRTKTVRLAVIGSSTLAHLMPSIRMAALRRGFWIEAFEGDYGMYYQELSDPHSSLRAFRPDFVLLALDASHLAGGGRSFEGAVELLTSCWDMARALGASVIQQTLMATEPLLLGNNEHCLPTSPAALVSLLNAELRARADEAGVALLAVDALLQRHGLDQWYDPSLWFHAKQEVHPRMAPEYGDHVARIIASVRGLSSKCLVLDLDNTLWGGVIGDDGMDGIVLGQGNASGEAHLSLQRYAKFLGARGCILAVCSKNDESVAREPFERHPEMVLRLEDIACFVANWQDKATNLRMIAQKLNIGLDSLVFVDDNPFERALVRRELPMVAVPELPEDPALYVSCLSGAGYFEATTVTQEDRERGALYRKGAEREALLEQSTDLTSYLSALEMTLIWEPFTRVGLARIAQLINKTNQFNLTTRRLTESDVEKLMNAPSTLGLQLRLVDRFGDHGVIAVVIGELQADTLELDTWLMSCRVLGRGVEEATLRVVRTEARRLGAARLTGLYIPTAKNGMVREHYRKLGFDELDITPTGTTRWVLPLDRADLASSVIGIRAGGTHATRADL